MIIYKVTNVKTGMIYIGQTLRGLSLRRAEHLQYAGNLSRVKYPSPFHKALREYGSGSFTWEVLEECISCDHMNERERFYIKLFNTMVPSGYNQTVGGHMSDTMSTEIRSKIAAAVIKAHQDPAYRAKVYPKLKGLTPPNKGVPMSELQKEKLSKARKAAYEVPGYVNPNVGQKRTPEQLENLRKGREKRVLPTGEAWHAAHGGQITEEVRIKMRAAKIGKKPANTKKIQCVETGEVFAGLTEVAEKMKLPRQSIWMQIKGKLKQVRGFTFRYV